MPLISREEHRDFLVADRPDVSTPTTTVPAPKPERAGRRCRTMNSLSGVPQMQVPVPILRVTPPGSCPSFHLRVEQLAEETL